VVIDATRSPQSLGLATNPSYSLHRVVPAQVPAALGDAEFVLVVTPETAAPVGRALCETVLDATPNAGLILLTRGAGEPNIEVVAEGGDREAFQDLLDELVSRDQGVVSAGEIQAFEGIVGFSRPIRNLCRLIQQVARSDSSILICGETGTGKELAARAIHRLSARRDSPFVGINCAAIPEALLESDLFGHTRGAFTGANSARKGLLQRARGGTVFFDEVGDMPVALQAKLLRALQERTVRSVGSDHDAPIDIRVLAATHEDLEVATQERRFRKDLLYRLNVIQVEMPRLADRGNDVLLIARFFLSRFAERSGKSITTLAPGVVERFLSYDWPGNVRELSNCIEHAVAFSGRSQLQLDDLPEKIRNHPSTTQELLLSQPAALVPLSEVERRYILRVVAEVSGNKARAARILGLDRKTLYRKLSQYKKEKDEAP
jgi:two-component system, NtrC family, response regulator AtoC